MREVQEPRVFAQESARSSIEGGIQAIELTVEEIYDIMHNRNIWNMEQEITSAEDIQTFARK